MEKPKLSRARLDKILANSGYGSRKEVKALIKAGNITVSGKVIKDPGYLVDLDKELPAVDGEIVNYSRFHYLMMNKPAGVVSSTWDPNSKTVIDLLTPPYDKFDLFPAGRLDKDTEGLLLITNDGQLAHNLLSPKKGVPKTYYAEVSGQVSPEDVQAFRQGIPLEEGFVTLPARLDILASGEISKAMVTVCEGKFHQVKRMFQALGKKVCYLKRISIGSLKLDEGLQPGTFRELTEKEVEALNNLKTNRYL
ncbi:MAG: pseudouridine synthase [Caldicoprobacterales bacterium]|jgi:16S rRNA pseudouridine516 synthase